MLYVFLVDTGTMLSFDMNLALGTVFQLKEAIARSCKIPEEKQVLLISGGESMQPHVRVFSYSAGTDTNPIFLFSKSTIESPEPPSPSIDYGSDTDLKEQVDGATNLPSTYMTLVARSQLAQQFHDVAKEQARVCEGLVHDQHLQQQGWAAVVANLDDITVAFKARTEMFHQNFNGCLSQREQYNELLANFSVDIDYLSRIPVLKALMNKKAAQGDIKEERIDFESSSDHNPISLLQWIHSSDRQSCLEQLADQCTRGLEQINSDVFEGLQKEVREMLAYVDRTDMKEVKGLGERLYMLDQLMSDAEKIVQEQGEQAQAFLQNQARAENLGDMSVLPDLCASHRKQLMVMLSNHQHLRDIHRRCIQAKQELSENLHLRLKWVMFVEKGMSEIDNKLVIYHENLKRLKRHLELLQQLHLAPKVYLLSVSEVVRRKAFSRKFLKWSRALSKSALELRDKEISARKEYKSKVGCKHFLSTMFPGLKNDEPPTYAVDAPTEFDSELPDIQISDIENLRSLLPEMASSLTLPDTESGSLEVLVTAEMYGRTIPATTTVVMDSDEPMSCRECFISAVGEMGLRDKTPSLVPPTHPPTAYRDTSLESPKDERDPEESEPDTEEFEKVDGGSGGLREVSGCCPPPPYLPFQQQSLPPPLSPTNRIEAEEPRTLPGGIMSPDDETSANSHDFITADFYIDESMPSSYTESNGTTGGIYYSTGVYLQGPKAFQTSPSIKSHHVIVAELLQRIEEKSNTIALLQEEVAQSRRQIHVLEDRLERLQNIENDAVLKLRQDVSDARQVVVQSRDDFFTYLTALSVQITDMVSLVKDKMDAEKDKALEETVNRLQSEHTAILTEVKQQLETEVHKHNDACREIYTYREQLVKREKMLQTLKEEMTNHLEDQKRQLLAERDQVVKEMTLEHEIELENLKENHSKENRNQAEKLKNLEQELQATAEEFDGLRREHSEMKDKLDERIRTEKEELTAKIKEDFSKMQSVAVEMALEKAKVVHRMELEAAHQEADERVKAALDEMRNALETSRAEERAKLAAELELEHRCNKESALKDLRETLSKEHKHELEGLRTRFRLAFSTTQGMERSPSDGSLEKIEPPETTTTESLRSDHLVHEIGVLKAELQEKELTIEEERLRHQRDIVELQQLCDRIRDESFRSMKASLTAEKQVVFNEAIQKATADKERQIQELRNQVEALREQLMEQEGSAAKMKALSFSLTSSDKSDNSPIKGALDQSAYQMVSPVNEPPALCSLVSSVQVSPTSEPLLETIPSNREGQADRLQRMMAMSTPSSSTALSQPEPEKVSVLTCNTGDLILFYYDERHENYLAFLGNTYHFLNTDCLAALSLIPNPGEPRKNWALGVVTHKECCEAKKERNRYHVARGTRFYRLLARPWTYDNYMKRSSQRHSTSSGRTTKRKPSPPNITQEN